MAENHMNVAIIFGGKSVEHSVSINSARNVFEYLDKSVYNLFLFGISRSGVWYFCDDFEKSIEEGEELDLSLSQPGLFKSRNSVYPIDLAFPLVHGTNGEDGGIQGMLNILEIPFVGTGVLGSALCMSKQLSKEVLAANNIPTSPFRSFKKHQKEEINFENLAEELGLPLMVKAANLGSSVGISKAIDKDTFYKALDDSFRYDHTVVIEKFITGREIECAVMGNENPEVSFPGEIVISTEYSFYSFDAKYVDPNAVSLEIPAKIEDSVRDEIMNSCREAYLVLKCEDFARVDIFLTETGEYYINEINTIPGFTNSSMFPMMWKHHGMSFTELLSKLIGLATSRYSKLKDIETTFNSKLD